MIEGLHIKIAADVVPWEQVVFVCQTSMLRVAVGLGVDGDTLYTSSRTSPDQSDGDFTTVCDEYFLNRLESDVHGAWTWE